MAADRTPPADAEKGPGPPGDHDGESSFFLDGLTVTPGEGSETEAPLPESNDEFELVAELGRGGMGVVYEAIDRHAGRRVALKVISPNLGLDENAIKRFEREARAAAAISHENCIFVYGVHHVASCPAISMELVRGESLEERIAREGVPGVERAVAWTLAILDGLEAAHAAGVIHRDVKPSNVFITADGTVKLGDFGLSRSFDSDVKLTMTGTFLGSPMYASPEQVRSRPLDHRTDIYSAGATLFALLTGAAPYGATSIGDLFAQITSEPPRAVRELRPEVPRGLERVIARALSKDPAKRFRDATAFRDALAPFAPGALTAAGLGFRWGAYCIDSLLGMLVAAGVLLAGQALAAPGTLGNVQINASSLPVEITMVLYLTLSEGLLGRSVGKAMLGLRVVTKSGGRPGLWRALLRAAMFESSDVISGHGLASELIGLAAFLALFVTMRKRNGFRGLHELASGTRVLETRPPFARVLKRRELLDRDRPPESGLPPRLGPYDVVGSIGPTPVGRLLVGRDFRLGRDVWLHLVDEADHRLSPGERDGADGGALRWLDAGEEEGRAFEVFEAAAGGASLDEYRQAGRGVDWATARTALLTLTDALRGGDGSLAPGRLWLDRTGRMRILPVPIGAAEQPMEPRELLAVAARVLLAVSDEGAALPANLPRGGEAAFGPLLRAGGPFDIEEFRARLSGLEAHPRTLHRPVRAAQLGVAAFGVLLVLPLVKWVASILPRPAPSSGDVVPRHLHDQEAILFAMMTVVAAALAFALRGGATFRLFRIRIVDHTGHPASRGRCAWRAAATWLPPMLIAVLGEVLARWGLGKTATAAFTVAITIPVAGAVYAAVRPSRSLQDLAAGTQLFR